VSAAPPERPPLAAVAAVAALLLAGAALAGGSLALLLALAGVVLAVIADARPVWIRIAAAAGALAGGGFALALAGGDPASVELVRIAVAAAWITGLARAADALLDARPRTGFWAGAVATALAAAALSIAMAYATARSIQPAGVVLGIGLAAASAWIMVPALAGPARASIGSWVGVGIAIAALAGLGVGSIDLPRLGTDAPAVPVIAAVAMVFGGRAVHELGLRRYRRAIGMGLMTLFCAIACIGIGRLAPGWDALAGNAVLAGRKVAVGPTWLMSPGMSTIVSMVALLLLFTATSAGRRFVWTLGWMSGLAVMMVGLVFLLGWLAGFEILGSVRPRVPSVTGATAMLALGLGVMQVSSKELRLQRQGALWLPVLAAGVLLAATVVAWQQAQRQQQALHRESAALALEQAGRAVREAVVARVEALSRIASSVRQLPDAERAQRLAAEADLFLRDQPGTVAVFMVGPDLVIREAFAGERASQARPGAAAAIDEARRQAYRAADTSNRAVMLGPLELSQTRGTGFLLIVPLRLQGERAYLVGSHRYGAILDDALATITSGFDLAVSTLGQTVFQRRQAATDPLAATTVSTDFNLLGLDWRIELAPQAGARQPGSALPTFILVAGFGLAILLASVLRLAAVARDRADEAAAAAAAQLAAQAALADSRAEAARVLDGMSEVVISLDRELRVVFANARAMALLHDGPAMLSGRRIGELLPGGIGTVLPADLERQCHDVLEDGASRDLAGYAPDLGIWLAGRVQAAGEGLAVVVQDVTEARRTEVFRREQREVLLAIAIGDPLPDILARICVLYDDMHPGGMCAVLLYDAAADRLRPGAGPKLAPDFLAGFDGLSAAPDAGPCGLAVQRRTRVVAEDLADDLRFGDIGARAAGIASCWAQPLLARDGEPLGVLGVHAPTRRAPGVEEAAALESLASLCAIAIERDQAQRRLAESEQRFRSLFDLQPDAVFAFDPEGRVVAVNEAAVQLGSYPREAILGHPFGAMIEPTDRERVRGMFDAALAGAPQRYSTIGVRADGKLRMVDVTNLPIMVDGRIVGVYGVTRDVTEQRAAEARLLERDRFFALSPAVFAISDGRGYYTQVNDALPQALGVSRQELLERPVLDFIHPDDAAETLYRARALGRGETLQGLVNRQLHADGGVRWMEWSLLRTDQDTIYATARDVTAEKLSQQSEALTRRVIEDSPAVLWRWLAVPHSRVDFVTENVSAWGYDKHAFESGLVSYESIVHPDDRARFDLATAQCKASGEARFNLVYRIVCRDGSVAWVDERTAIVRDDGGAVQYWQGLTLDVTAVMQAREQQDRLVRTIGDGPAVLWRFNPYLAPTVQMVTANVRQWGYAPEDFTSGAIRFNDLVHPDDRVAVVLGDLARIEAREDRFSREYRLRCADCRWVWISEHLQAVREDDGTLAFCLALSVDVTEQRRASEQERQLRQVIEASPAVLWRFRLGDAVPTRLVSANVRDWGYTPDDFTSGRLLFDDLIHRDDHLRVQQATREAVESGAREMQVEFRFRTADGRWLWLDERVTLLRDSAGQVDDCVSLTLDVTPQRRALEAVRERDQFFALSLEVFAVIDAQGRLRQVNEALARVLGFDATQMAGHRLVDYVHPLDTARAAGMLATLAAGDRVALVELRCRHATGGWRFLEWNAAAGSGGLSYCAARDVTEHRRVSAELRRALRDLELRNAELQDFAFVASHDLQEPLRKVQAFSDRLIARYGSQLDAQGLDYLRRMDAAAVRMQTLIDSLLDYSRVSTRGGSFQRVDLGRVLGEVLVDLDARVEASGAEVQHGPMPVLDADPTQMRQLLQNLLGNALKFSVPGRAPRVQVRAEPVELGAGSVRRDGWRITVADNGIGFAAEFAERIFAPFQRLHGRSEYEGTGIGLAIVRKIVERHGGTVEARGEPGVGATFIVELPAAAALPDPAPQRAREPALVHHVIDGPA
jgi:PAS domain S-box-containing protein